MGMDCIKEHYEQTPPQPLRVFDSDSMKALNFLPRSVAIVGGGIIAVEFARIFAQMSAKVTLVVRGTNLANSLERVGIDHDIAQQLEQDLKIAKVKILPETEVAEVKDAAKAGRGKAKEEKKKKKDTDDQERVPSTITLRK